MSLSSSSSMLAPFFSWAGTRKEGDCKSERGESICVLCQEGVEYTEEKHFSDKCRRCTLCDGEHGKCLKKQSERPVMVLHVEQLMIQFEIGT